MSVLNPEQPSPEQLKLAGFYVGGEVYGIQIDQIKEVIQASPYPLRYVPGAPELVEGVIELRGLVIPVIDLRRIFHSQMDFENPRFHKLIIVSLQGRIAGLKVDRVLRELRVDPRDIKPAPMMVHLKNEDQPRAMFRGVCRVDGRLVLILDLSALLLPKTANPVD